MPPDTTTGDCEVERGVLADDEPLDEPEVVVPEPPVPAAVVAGAAAVVLVVPVVVEPLELVVLDPEPPVPAEAVLRAPDVVATDRVVDEVPGISRETTIPITTAAAVASADTALDVRLTRRAAWSRSVVRCAVKPPRWVVLRGVAGLMGPWHHANLAALAHSAKSPLRILGAGLGR